MSLSILLSRFWPGLLIGRNETMRGFLAVAGHVVERQIRYEIAQDKVPCKRKVSTEKCIGKL